MHARAFPTDHTRSPAPRRRAWRAAFLLLATLLPTYGRADDGGDFFEKKVRPILVEHCYSCHSANAKKEKGGLRLDTPDAIRRGGDSGPVVKANDEDSLLLRAVAHAPNVPAMPPKGKLPDAAVADLRKWVKMGAPLPTATATKPAVGEAARKFWSFQPVAEHPAPKVSDPKWPIKKADFFVLKKLDEQKLAHAPHADKRTLIRRVYFDLIGLPPTFEQVEAFAADTRPDAYERLVDGLLASPRFGEKWGRHWLDVARYAEDNSTSEATCKPPRFPYRYRDWVIAAFNADVPFDRFVRLQLAADLLPDTPPADYAALGFLGLSPVYHKEPKLSKDVIAAFVADEWDERVDAITRGFLGLTVACARCHDHKFDPITAEDYYALAGVMANTQLAERPLKPAADASQDALTTVRLDLLDATLRLGYAKEMRGTAVKEKTDTAPFDKQIKTFEARVADLKKREKELDTGPTANVVRDAGTWVNGDDPAWTVIDYRPGKYRDLPVFVRGNPARPGEIVPRRFLEVLSTGEPKPFREGSGRRELADAIVTDAAGLTARVFVNRTWGWVFGRPLVTTPSNFGALGDRPTHPELLDDLAARFVANRLVDEVAGPGTGDVRGVPTVEPTRREVRRRGPGRPVAVAGTRKRLELEAWRDAILQVSGQLNLAGGGPSDNLDGLRSVRRTVYGKVSRERPADIHRLFDLPDPRATRGEAGGDDHPAPTTLLPQQPVRSSVGRGTGQDSRRPIGRGRDASRSFGGCYCATRRTEELETAVKLIAPAKDGDPRRVGVARPGAPGEQRVPLSELIASSTMTPLDPTDPFGPTRRSFLRELGGSVGLLGLASFLQATDAPVPATPPGKPHFKPRAKRVIFLFMAGGPSHLDTFDPKPALDKYAGKRPDATDLRTERVTGGVLPSPFKFRPGGKSGLPVSDLLPNIRECADELCVLRAVHAINPNHSPAANFLASGRIDAVHPGIGAWVSYGLGSENADLPGFVSLGGGFGQVGFERSGYLPGQFQATRVAAAEADPEKMIRHLRNPAIGLDDQKRQLDALQSLNRTHAAANGNDPQLEARVRAMETAFRMQSAAGRSVRHPPRAAAGARVLRAGRVRPRLPAGPAAGRARRPVRAIVPRRVGPPRRHQRRAEEEVRRDRPPDRGPAEGSPAAGTARRHAGGLGRRVRPHPGVGERRRPRPQPLRVHDVDGRRRGEGRHRPTARPTSSASRPRRAASASTTCTRPSCTCSASTTRS